MSTPSPDQAEAGPSTVPATATPTDPRPIYLFFGNPTSAPVPGPAQTAPKRKRKKGEDSSGQAKLSAHGSWEIARMENGSNGSGTAAFNGKGKKRAEVGEEAEMREMVRRARMAAKEEKVAAKEEKKARDAGRKASAGSTEKEGDTVQASLSEGVQNDPPPSTPSKRKRGRPRKSDQPPTKPTPPRPDVVDLISPAQAGTSRHRSSSPIEITATGQHLQSSHPFFSRSTSSAGAIHDPIDVELDTSQTRLKSISGPGPGPGPKKLAFAADAKPAHSFFAALRGGSRSRGGSVVLDTAVPEPIMKVTVKVNGNGTNGVGGSTHSMLKANGTAPGGLKKGWGRGVKEGEGWRAPLPCGIWPNHSNDAATSTTRAKQMLSKRKRRRISNSASTYGDGFWPGVLRQAVSSEARTTSAKGQKPCSTPSFILQHPAFTSMSHRERSSNREGWCERYRPRQAQEVLGNEVEATYLRDWLRALEVGGGRKVHRKLKKVKRQLFDGWIVDDIGLFGEALESDDDDDEVFEEYEEPNLALGERPNDYPALEARLTNAILLTGPHGCGKSAAVHAAADELGWEVFEVYPGMGKRTGASLMSWVGDVGKNHMVVKHAVKGDKKGMEGFFGKQKKPDLQSPLPTKSTKEDKSNGELEVLGDGNGEAVRQSLILIEEADILFAEENTFWPAVISLIAESRRPVILTCNDPSRVPREQLPLQAVLHFHSPPSYLALSYLESIAAREQLKCSTSGEYKESCLVRPYDLLDQPLAPNGNERLPYVDLRKGITQMQLDRQLSGIPSHEVGESSNRDMATLCRRMIATSYADAFVAPRDWARLDVSEIDRHEPTPDDELGVSALVKPEIDENVLSLPAYDRSNEMSDEITLLVGGALPLLDDLSSSRTQYIRSLLPLLDPLIPLGSHLLPHPCLFTDHIPIIQSIVQADDILQLAEDALVAAGGHRVNRKTGRAIRISAAGVLAKDGFTRYLDVGREGLEAARRSRLEYGR